MNKVFCIYCCEKVPYGKTLEAEQFTIQGVNVECVVEKAYCRQCGNAVYVPQVNDINCKIRMAAFLKAKENA